MRNQLVTIFGGTGFIGRYVVGRLAERGARIRVISRDPRAHGTHLQPLGDVDQIVVERARLDQPEDLARAVDGAAGVINLIGILYETRRQRFEEVHGAFPGRLAAAAASGGARFVQVSAIGADPDSPSAYARSKAEGERRVRATLPAATIVRPSIVIGPEDDFFNRFAAMARFLPMLPLIGGGRTRFQPVYVCDLAEAVVRCLETTAAGGQTYEVGGPRVYSFAELMRYLLEVIGRRRWLMPMPFELARLPARILELAPVPPLTRDQVELLKADNVVAAGALGLADLGITPTPIELVAPAYLSRYRALPLTATSSPH